MKLGSKLKLISHKDAMFDICFQNLEELGYLPCVYNCKLTGKRKGIIQIDTNRQYDPKNCTAAVCEWLTRLASLLLESGNHELALSCCQQVLHLDGIANSSSNSPRESKYVHSRSVVNAFAIQGHALLSMKLVSQAAESFRVAIDIFPGRPELEKGFTMALDAVRNEQVSQTVTQQTIKIARGEGAKKVGRVPGREIWENSDGVEFLEASGSFVEIDDLFQFASSHLVETERLKVSQVVDDNIDNLVFCLNHVRQTTETFYSSIYSDESSQDLTYSKHSLFWLCVLSGIVSDESEFGQLEGVWDCVLQSMEIVDITSEINGADSKQDCQHESGPRSTKARNSMGKFIDESKLGDLCISLDCVGETSSNIVGLERAHGASVRVPLSKCVEVLIRYSVLKYQPKTNTCETKQSETSAIGNKRCETSLSESKQCETSTHSMKGTEPSNFPTCDVHEAHIAERIELAFGAYISPLARRFQTPKYNNIVGRSSAFLGATKPKYESERQRRRGLGNTSSTTSAFVGSHQSSGKMKGNLISSRKLKGNYGIHHQSSCRLEQVLRKHHLKLWDLFVRFALSNDGTQTESVAKGNLCSMELSGFICCCAFLGLITTHSCNRITASTLNQTTFTGFPSSSSWLLDFNQFCDLLFECVAGSEIETKMWLHRTTSCPPPVPMSKTKLFDHFLLCM